jgi:hypothetical protein
MAFDFFSPKLLSQSLKVAGYEDPALHQQLDAAPVAPAPVAPAPVAAPAPLNQALEVAGSDYRAPTEVAPLNPNQSLKALSKESLAGKNDLIQQTAHSGDVQAAGSAAVADEAGAQEADLRATTDDANGAIHEDTKHRREIEKLASERLDSIISKIDNPPPSITEKVFNALSSGLASGGMDSASEVVKAIGNFIGLDAVAYNRQLSSDKQAYEALLKQAGHDGESEDHEAKLASAVNANLVAPYEAALKRIAATTNSAEAKRSALEAAAKLRQGYLDAEVQHKSAGAAAAGSSAIDREMYRAISNAKTPEEAANIAAGYGKKGQTALQDIQKSAQNVANIGKTAADTEKTLAESAKTAGDAKSPKLSESEAKTDTVVKGAKLAYSRLNKLVDAGGEVNRGATKEGFVPDMFRSAETLQQRADTNALVGAVLRVESGSAISDDEVANKRAALGLDSGDPDVRAAGFRSLLAAYKALDRQGSLIPKTATGEVAADVKGGVNGISQEQAVKSAQPAPAPAQPALVSVVNPDTGEARLVKPSLVEAYAAHGFVPGRALGQPVRGGIPREEYAGAGNTTVRPEGGI